MRATQESFSLPPTERMSSPVRSSSSYARPSSSHSSSTNTQAAKDSGTAGSEANAAQPERAERRIPRALPSKYSSAAARTADTKSSAAASLAKKQLMPQVTHGSGLSTSSSSLMMPSVPSDPMKRSTASMSSSA